MKKNNLTLTIAGASGVIGRHIIARAQKEDWNIRVLTRNRTSQELSENNKNILTFVWNPEQDLNANIETVHALEGSDFLINLAGTGIADGRLGKKMQTNVLSSRLKATNLLIDAYQKCKSPPAVWGQTSATGFYGDTNEENVTEINPPGNLFLSKVCVEWENTVRQITEINPDIRLIIGRFGIVLAKDAPAWQKMIQPIQAGFGGAIGSGNQWISWIDADDLAGAFFYLYSQKSAKGVYNFTSPDPVRQKDFAVKIAKFLNKPVMFKIPGFIIRLMLGKTADELILASCKAIPEKLIQSGYAFEYSRFDQEIEHLLKNINMH